MRAHTGHPFFYKTDIANFFPSITIDRVNRLFLRELGCSYEVSRFLTRFCTYDYHLALGLVTSPILADQILRNVDNRMASLCATYGLTITRFVDDITISGPFDISDSDIPEKLGKILRDHGFQPKTEKTYGGRLDQKVTITGLRVKGMRIDVAKEYVQEVERQLADHASLAAGGPFCGPYCTESQLAGRVHYISWVNRSRLFGLKRKLQTIRWSEVWREAQRRGLVQARKKITKRNEAGPDYSECFGRDSDGSKIEPQKHAMDGEPIRELCPFDT